MSKQTAEPPSRAMADEKSATGVGEAPTRSSSERQNVRDDKATVKQQQKVLVNKADHDELMSLYKEMLLIRRFEEKCAEAYSMGKIGGFCHLYIGQEACAVGAISAIRKDDYVLTSYREHAHAIAKGISADAVMAELFGKRTGCSNGMGGSMHMFDKSVNFLGGHGIVGGQIPLATGVAFSSKYRGTDQVTLCFFGEAAVNQGAFHESLNMAQLWKVPCIYICENNKYGMGTSQDRAMSLSNVAQKACAYEMASEFVDGMDVLAVREATRRAVERARKESLPTLLEVRTYRFMGHSMSDPGNYRTRAEIEKYQERDPIKVFSETLKENDICKDAELKKIDDDVKQTVEQSVRFADESPEPAPEELYKNIYKTPVPADKN